MDFKNKIAIVTGAARGIGEAVARELAMGGATVAMTDVQSDALAEAAANIRAAGGRVRTFVNNVCDEADVHRVVDAVAAEFGRIDILVNNAGVYDDYMPFEQQSSDAWKRKIDINILGTMYFTQAALRWMTAQHAGRIVNLASVAAVYGIEYFVDYSMTKGAIVSFTRALAKHVAPNGITVNAVSPGNIHAHGGNLPDMSFLGRSGSCEECAHVICFLASDDASYVSGQNYQVDGCRRAM